MSHESTDFPSLDPEDLALNAPGATLRAKASEIQREHPVRVFLAKVFGVHTEERAWRRGADGEREVGRRLDQLGDDWLICHSVPVGENDADIDHVVIGPSGVFTLNTKNHLGKRVTVYSRAIYVSGTKQPYIAKSRAEGKRASKLLSAACGFTVQVRPVIVIMANELIVKEQPDDVSVVGRRGISQWLRAQPQCLSAQQSKEIFAAARRRSTWVNRA